MGVHACVPGPQETKAGASGIQGLSHIVNYRSLGCLKTGEREGRGAGRGGEGQGQEERRGERRGGREEDGRGRMLCLVISRSMSSRDA